MAIKYAGSPDALILTRLVNPKQANLSREAAQAILDLEFAQEDRDRMHTLSLKAQEGTLLPDEQQEIESYRRIGYFLDLLRSKARKTLKNSKN